MSKVPAWQPIGRTDPPTQGDHVKKAQWLLEQNPFENFQPGDHDGVAGPVFEAAVVRAKHFLGYPGTKHQPIFGVRLYLFLSGRSKLPLTFRVRRRRRLKKHNSAQGVRGRVIEWCRWGVQHTADIHYSKTRPIPTNLPAGHLPLSTDCSGSTILFARWGGAPDPGGFDFNGAGSSASMGAHLRRIPRSAAQPADLVVWPGHHVAVVLEPGADPLLESHGMERGPLAIRLSDELAFHRGESYGFFSLL